MIRWFRFWPITNDDNGMSLSSFYITRRGRTLLIVNIAQARHKLALPRCSCFPWGYSIEKSAGFFSQTASWRVRISCEWWWCSQLQILPLRVVGFCAVLVRGAWLYSMVNITFGTWGWKTVRDCVIQRQMSWIFSYHWFRAKDKRQQKYLRRALDIQWRRMMLFI